MTRAPLATSVLVILLTAPSCEHGAEQRQLSPASEREDERTDAIATGESIARDPLAASTTRTKDAPCPDSAQELASSPLVSLSDERWRAGPVVVVRKAHRRLMVFDGARLRRGSCVPVALAWNHRLGPKRVLGDHRTPEGWYRTSDKPASAYYGAILVHYPNVEDARAGRALGLLNPSAYRAVELASRRQRPPPQNTRMGGQILIHGGGSAQDWTLGCVGLRNDHMDELRAALPRDMQVDLLILP